MARVRDIRGQSDLLEGAREISEALNRQADALAEVSVPEGIDYSASITDIIDQINLLRETVSKLTGAIGG